MHIERMHKMIECLTEKALSEIENGLETVDTCEMGQVIDMIKDLNEAEYRAVIVKAMKEADEEEEEREKELLKVLKEEYGEDVGRRYYDRYRYADGRFASKGKGAKHEYDEPPYWHMTPEMYRNMERNRDVDRMDGRMYYTEPIVPIGDNMRDRREGKSGMSRRSYMESKELHKGNTPEDKDAKMHDLERYMKELSEDMAELISDMTPEERTMTKSKLSTLVSKM